MYCTCRYRGEERRCVFTVPIGTEERRGAVCGLVGRRGKRKGRNDFEVGFLSDVTRWALWAGQGQANRPWLCRCSDWWRRLGVPSLLTASTSLTWGCTTSGLVSPFCLRCGHARLAASTPFPTRLHTVPVLNVTTLCKTATYSFGGD